jgi:hypothetical protein
MIKIFFILELYHIMDEDESDMHLCIRWILAALCKYTLQSLCQNMTQTDSKCEHITVHTVTQTSPCPILSCVEKAPKYAHVSLIPVADSDQSSCNQPSASGVLQDVHIVRLLKLSFHVQMVFSLLLYSSCILHNLQSCCSICCFLELDYAGVLYIGQLDDLVILLVATVDGGFS